MIFAPGRWLAAARDGGAAVLLLGALISGAQWLLRRVYGERSGAGR